jgi:aspartate/methionine/tyrosine aminotransferase
VAIVDVPRIQPEEDWAVFLLSRHGILVQPGFFYDFDREAFLVLSLLPHPSEFDEAAARFAAAMRTH